MAMESFALAVAAGLTVTFAKDAVMSGVKILMQRIREKNEEQTSAIEQLEEDKDALVRDCEENCEQLNRRISHLQYLVIIADRVLHRQDSKTVKKWKKWIRDVEDAVMEAQNLFESFAVQLPLQEDLSPASSSTTGLSGSVSASVLRRISLEIGKLNARLNEIEEKAVRINIHRLLPQDDCNSSFVSDPKDNHDGGML